MCTGRHASLKALPRRDRLCGPAAPPWHSRARSPRPGRRNAVLASRAQRLRINPFTAMAGGVSVARLWEVILLSALLIFIPGCGSGGGSSDADGEEISATLVRDAAAAVYDAIEDGQDLEPVLAAVLEVFGIHTFGPTELDAARMHIAGGVPTLLTAQLRDLAAAMDAGVLVSLDSFIGEMNDRDAVIRDSGTPLTRQFLSNLFAHYQLKPVYGPAEKLPALIVALASERAVRRDVTDSDPVWGDGYLDPLQFTLMLYAVLYSVEKPVQSGAQTIALNLLAAAAEPSSVIETLRSLRRGLIAGEIGKFVQVPLELTQASSVVLCASVLIYGHKTTVQADPDEIWHDDGAKPAHSRLTTTLVFQDNYWDEFEQFDHRDFLGLLGCNPPPRGPVAGNPVEWSTDLVPRHGNFDFMQEITGSDGQANSVFRTVKETTSPARRTPQNVRATLGTVTVRINGLVPGWSRLEWIVTRAKPVGRSGASGWKSLFVFYYVDPCNPEATSSVELAHTLAPAVVSDVCVDQWQGTSSSTGPLWEAGADVTWKVDAASSTAQVVSYYPEGTVRATRYFADGCTVAPASAQIARTDGILTVDYATNPPSYTGDSSTSWEGVVTCGEFSFGSEISVKWFVGAGSLSPDDGDITDLQSHGGVTYNFTFGRQ